jgi:hypothetical protein
MEAGRRQWIIYFRKPEAKSSGRESRTMQAIESSEQILFFVRSLFGAKSILDGHNRLADALVGQIS